MAPAFGQHYIDGVSSSYFSYVGASGPTVYYQRGKYEIFLNINNYVGIRNVDTHNALIRPVLYSNFRINDTAYSTVDSVILKLKQNILK